MPFTFATAGQVVVGCGTAARLPELAAAHGSRPFLCTGGEPSRALRLLPDAGAPFPVPGEPTVDAAADALRTARAAGADVVVAVGGGSVIDLAKAVAALLANGGEPMDYLEVVGRGQPLRERSAPCIAVPTTAGTGSEVTANAVLAAPSGVKVSMRSPLMLPALALVDPELTLTCPPGVTAASGLDALTQCLEPFVSPFATPLTDGLAREGLLRAARALRRAHRDGGDIEARTDMSVCSLLGGLALANAKLGAVHGLAGAVGGLTGRPHGAVCAALLAPVVAVNVRALRQRDPGNPAVHRYEQAARLLTGRDDAGVEDAVAWLREVVVDLAVPPLPHLTDDDLAALVASGQRASSMRGNPIELTDAEVAEILVAASDSH